MNAKLSPISYLGLIIAFVLPILTFSCQGHKIASLNGYQLAFGTELEMTSPLDGSKSKEEMEGSPIVAAALILGLIAAAIAFKSGIGGAVVAGLAAGCLLFAQSQINKEVMEGAGGMVAVNFQAGFYLSLFLLAAGGILGVVEATKRRAVAPAEAASPLPAVAPEAGR